MLLLIFNARNITVLSKRSFVTIRIFGVLLTYTAFKSGDFGIVSYFDFQKKKIVTNDDKVN